MHSRKSRVRKSLKNLYGKNKRTQLHSSILTLQADTFPWNTATFFFLVSHWLHIHGTLRPFTLAHHVILRPKKDLLTLFLTLSFWTKKNPIYVINFKLTLAWTRKSFTLTWNPNDTAGKPKLDKKKNAAS